MMLDLRDRQHPTQDVSRISVGAQCRETVAKDPAGKCPKPKRGFVMATTLYPLQHVEEFVQCQRCDRPVGDAPSNSRNHLAFFTVAGDFPSRSIFWMNSSATS